MLDRLWQQHPRRPHISDTIVWKLPPRRHSLDIRLDLTAMMTTATELCRAHLIITLTLTTTTTTTANVNDHQPSAQAILNQVITNENAQDPRGTTVSRTTYPNHSLDHRIITIHSTRKSFL